MILSASTLVCRLMLLIIFCLAETHRSQSNEGNSTLACSSHFHCANLCCDTVNKVCRDSIEDCKYHSYRVYVGIGIIAAIFLVGSFIYLVVKLKVISTNIKALKKEFEEDREEMMKKMEECRSANKNKTKPEPEQFVEEK